MVSDNPSELKGHGKPVQGKIMRLYPLNFLFFRPYTGDMWRVVWVVARGRFITLSDGKNQGAMP